jgi:two-component sensor histidine kinase
MRGFNGARSTGMSRLTMDIDLALALESEPEAATRARRAIDDRFARALPTPLVIDLMTVISELVNNAVVHGTGTPVKVRVKAARGGRGVSGEVEADGVGRIAMRDMDGIGGGFGLHIVDALVGRWGVYEGSTHVWFEMSAANRL